MCLNNVAVHYVSIVVGCAGLIASHPLDTVRVNTVAILLVYMYTVDQSVYLHRFGFKHMVMDTLVQCSGLWIL